MISIDEEKCNGCGQCITDCAEGALTIVDGKARLISETYCDGLGACLNCPMGALKLEMREAPAFDEEAALKAKSERERKASASSANNSLNIQLTPLQPLANREEGGRGDFSSSLQTWPVQLELASPQSKWLENADLLLAAHCAGFALPEIQDEIKGKVLLIACPKLENRQKLTEKLAAIFKTAKPKSVEILRMSVPCCGGLENIVSEAKKIAQSDIPQKTKIVSL